MSNSLLSIWHFNNNVGTYENVIPDGCRDLIMTIARQEQPTWSVSPLFEQSKFIYMTPDTQSVGFRLKPGVEIKEPELLNYFKNNNVCIDVVKNVLDDFTNISDNTKEALDCLASDVDSIKQASNRLGITPRTLQRLILRKTQKTPSYWFQLARARKSAKVLKPYVNLAEVAEKYGFSDQSHMNREFRRWFRSTPTQLMQSSKFIKQLNGKGYC
jgi:AraC-like DNA-binding protein